jgi:hypothetical protein
MSEARQTVTRSLSLSGRGYFPAATPAHHEDLLIGTIGGIPRFESPTIWRRRTNPLSGSVFIFHPQEKRFV